VAAGPINPCEPDQLRRPTNQAGERRYLCWRAHVLFAGIPFLFPLRQPLPLSCCAHAAVSGAPLAFSEGEGRVAVVRGLTAPFRLIAV